jgi:enterochelin esterase-like enzyme
MKLALPICLLLVSSMSVCQAQDYSKFTATVKALHKTDSTEIDLLWTELVESDNIPLIFEDSVAFLYRGKANSVVWMGDFNGWGHDQKFQNKGKVIPGTDIWVLKSSFPKDARLDYKIVLNDSEWILDPHNRDRQWSGVGGGSPNSELRMPNWQPDPIATEPVLGLRRGRIETDLLLNSKMLSYQITYSVYLPQGYSPNHKYPVIYVTDGYEYLHERLGNMALILDNLIHLQKIPPVVAVFIDHREPVNRAINRRMQELAMNENYLQFITDELIPTIEKNYGVSNESNHRAILGTSMGGLAAAYFAFSKPGVFGLSGIQSPAFWFKPDIYELCDNPENPPLKVFMTTGLINDAQEGAKKMKRILDKNTCQYQYLETNQGHSWGNWRDLIDDILIYFFASQSK